MNRLSIILVTMLIAIVAGVALAGVEQTKHNFASATYSPNAYFTGTTQICVFCHATHNASTTVGQLWNHESNESQIYDMYWSPTIDMPMATSPRTGSMVCLSCHDGTIAVNSLNNVPGPATTGNYGSPGGSALDASGRLTSSSDAYVGTDLRDDHPIGITYDASQDPTGFNPKTGVPTNYPDRLLSEGSYVECNSCHNPHDNTFGNFLVESNTNSQLCMRCHTK